MAYKDNYKDDKTKYIHDESPFEGSLGGLIALAVAGTIGGVAAIKTGAARPAIEKMIGKLGSYRGTRLSALSQGLKAWSSKTEGFEGSFLRSNWLDNIKGLANKSQRPILMQQTQRDLEEMRNQLHIALTKRVEASTKGGVANASKGRFKPDPNSLRWEKDFHWLYSDPEFIRSYKNAIKIKDDLIAKGESAVAPMNKMYEELVQKFSLKPGQQEQYMKRYGHRLLTLGDVMQKGPNKGDIVYKMDLHNILDEGSVDKLKDSLEFLVKRVESTKVGSKVYNWKDIYLDKNLYINSTGQMKDLRPIANSVRKIVDTASNDFHIPFIKLNPMKLFYVEKAFQPEKPLFAILEKGTILPAVTGNFKPVQNDLYYIAGNVYNPTNLNTPIAKGLELHSSDAGRSAIARHLKDMYGLSLKQFEEYGADDGIKHFWGKIAKKLDVGFQDVGAEPFSAASPMTYMSVVDKILKGPLKPFKNLTDSKELSDIFGTHGYIVMKKSPRLRDMFDDLPTTKQILDHDITTEQFKALAMGKRGQMLDWMKQFAATRNRPEEITPMGLIPYVFFNRLDNALGSLGLGMNAVNKGSAWQIYKNLMFKRILPVMAGSFYLGYMDDTIGNITGEEPSDVIADAYANASINFASMRDMFGITKTAKDWKGVFSGGEQIADIPIVGMPFRLTKTAEEVEREYESGMEPVRKGRYWSLGNTPLTGMQIEYWRPNLYRRMKSDWEYTETLYGSKDEFYEKHTMFPTLQHPLAPITHFITDNRAMEEAHYKDRPYPVSEGINEIKGIPILGPMLDATLGHLLKPPKRMHEEYWEGDMLIERPDLDQPGQPVMLPEQGGTEEYATRRTDYSSKASQNSYTSDYVNQSNQQVTNKEYAPITPISTVRVANGNPPPTEENGESYVYTTAGGKIKVVEAPGRQNIREVNEALKSKSLAKSIRGVRQKYMREELPETLRTSTPEHDDIGKGILIDVQELGGIYGFSALNFIDKDLNWADELASPSDINSWTDTFWEANLGGIGGEISEIYRRFIPRDKNKMKEYNPIRNTQATWMPGSDYFIDFQHGDPYRIPYGEIRVPGAAYEKINNMKDPTKLTARASMLGKSKEEMISYFFHENDVMNEAMEEATTEGTRIHKKIAKEFAEAGFLIDAEVPIYDKEYDYTGHYDARIVDSTSPTREAVLDVKTLSEGRWAKLQETGQPFEEHVAQINAYMHTLKIPKAYLYYTNRDDENAAPIIKELVYDDELFKETMEKLQDVRKDINRQIESGERARGDLYDYVTRFKILANAAPYSKEFQEYKALMSQIQLSDEEKQQIRDAKDQLKEQRERVRMYPYRFSTANLEYETVHVTKVLNNNMFLTEEHPDNPIKLAGIHVPTGKNDKAAKEAEEYISKVIHEGATVTIGYDADEANMISKDTYRTIRAAVSPGRQHLTNINYELKQRGLAKEMEEDYSPAAVHARFSPIQRAMGSMWEKIAHLDTFVNTKLLQVRSPIEQYKRREVYGKNFQDWSSPIKDYVMPTLDTMAAKSPVVATGVGAIVGLLFGGRSAYGKVVGTLIGATIGGASSSYVHARQATKGERWIPERRRKERDINEYMDILKFIKSRKLYVEYSELAKEKEGFDVAEYMRTKEEKGQERKKEIKRLADIKRQLKLGDINYKEALKESGIDDDIKIKVPKGKKLTKDEIEERKAKQVSYMINQRIGQLGSHRELEKIGPLALKAIMYYQQSEQTMYGFDKGESLQNAFMSLPKKDREYFQAFLRSPEEEKPEILSVAPRYMRRMLEAAWGMPVEDKPDLNEYFKKHQLPNEEWEGWQEDIPLEAVKVKLVKHEGLDATEFNIWPEQEEAAANVPVRAPQMSVYDNANSIRSKLKDILHEAGLEDIRVEVAKNNTGKLNVHTDVQQDKRYEIEQYLKEHGHRLLS